MATSNRTTGHDLWIKYGGTEVSGGYRNFDFNPTIDLVESTAGTENSKSYIATLKDATATLTYADEHVSGTSVRPDFLVGSSKYLDWGPRGSVAGMPHGGGTAIVQSHTQPHEYAGLLVRTVTFQFSGDLDFDPEQDKF